VAGMGKFLKQAQKMQTEMANTQENLKNKTVSGTSGGGVVQVVVTCDKKIQSVKIDPSFFEEPDAEMLQDLIVAASNQALDEAEKVSSEELGKITQGLQVPGLNF